MYNWQLITSSEFNNKYWKNSKAKAYDTVDEKVFENNPYSSRDYYTLGEFLTENKTQVWKKWWECAKFVNDYLEKYE